MKHCHFTLRWLRLFHTLHNLSSEVFNSPKRLRPWKLIKHMTVSYLRKWYSHHDRFRTALFSSSYISLSHQSNHSCKSCAGSVRKYQLLLMDIGLSSCLHSSLSLPGSSARSTNHAPSQFLFPFQRFCIIHRTNGMHQKFQFSSSLSLSISISFFSFHCFFCLVKEYQTQKHKIKAEDTEHITFIHFGYDKYHTQSNISSIDSNVEE